MNEVLAGDQAKQENDMGVMETVIDVADLFWDVCFSAVYPDSKPVSKVKT